MPSTLRNLIERAYDEIGAATPIPADCGKLCGAACCEGDEEVGMLLFPGEAAMLWRVPGFKVWRFRYLDAPAWLLTCDGNCDRRLRPLACRIFPLGPRVDAQGNVTAAPDPRGRRMCPLADGEFLDPRFRRRVGRALSLLAAEPRMLDLMRRISRESGEMELFFR